MIEKFCYLFFSFVESPEVIPFVEMTDKEEYNYGD